MPEPQDSYQWEVNPGDWDWQSPGASNHSGGCVEVGHWRGSGVEAGDAPWCGVIPVRDSHSRSTVILVPRYDMQLFIGAVKGGEYDWVLDQPPA
jgi:Domain of unknown function (DUF397)